MPLLENIGVMSPVVAFGPFQDVDVAASQTNVQLLQCGTGSDGIPMPKAGHVIGMLWSLSAAGSAGALSIGVTIDGTEDADTTQAITTAAEGYPTWMISDVAPAFAAGQQIGVEITTDGSWNGTTSDLSVWLIVVFDDWDYH